MILEVPLSLMISLTICGPTCRRLRRRTQRKILELEKLDEGSGLGSSNDRPAGAASKIKGSREKRGKALIRDNFEPRQELFTRDMTDCPTVSSFRG